MSVVVELNPRLSREEALVLAGHIREAQARIAGDLHNLMAQIEKLYKGRGWEALGYQSWEECCAGEFSEVQLWSTVQERAERSMALRGASMSFRGIAAILGVGTSTVFRDLSGELSGVPNGTPDNGEILKIQGIDGVFQPATNEKDAISERRERVEELRDQGLTQTEIAKKLSVSQGTVSKDISEASKAKLAGGLANYVALASTVSFSSPLPDEAEDVLATASANLNHLYNEIVMADEWMETDVRQAIVQKMTPAIANVLLVVSSIIKEIKLQDLPDDESIRLAWTQALAQASSNVNSVR